MSKGKNWVDFKEIKEKVSMEMVLSRYDIIGSLKQTKQGMTGPCPIHGGKPKSNNFSVSFEKNIWQCFGDCKNGGNVLDFVAGMEKETLREAGLRLKKWFLSESHSSSQEEKKKDLGKTSESSPKGNKLVREEKSKPIENKPLDFELKLEPEHAFFEERGIDQETVKHFGLGYCNKGMMKERIAIPVHDDQGQLVAYCGKAITEEQLEEAKYKQPPNFFKSEVVYNLFRVPKEYSRIILVESFISVWWLHQNGFVNTGALQGSSLSEKQEQLICDRLGPDGDVILLFDGDEDGLYCAEDCLFRLGQKLFVKAIDISQVARKPHQLTPEQLKSFLQ